MVYAFTIRWSLCAKSEGADVYLVSLGNVCLEGAIALLRLLLEIWREKLQRAVAGRVQAELLERWRGSDDDHIPEAS